MTKRRNQGANHPTGNAIGEDSLTRLVRLIARQEALRIFSGALESPAADAERARLSNRSIPSENRPETMAKADPSLEPGQRLLSVAEVAVRLHVSEKTVRRKIATFDLPAGQRGRPYSLSHPGASP